MPDKVLWLESIPSALLDLQGYGPDELITRQVVQVLLSVEKRRATIIMREAGGQMEGKDLKIRRIALQLYLEKKGDPKAIRAERERAKAFAGKLDQMRREFIEKPPAFVPIPLKEAQQMERAGLEGLPAGVHLSPGRMVFEFRTPLEAREQLFAVSVAIGKEDSRFDELVQVEKPEVSMAKVGPEDIEREMREFVMEALVQQ